MYMHMRTSENIVLQALMDEHQENRDLQNITAEILNREKARIVFTFTYISYNFDIILQEECFEALESISRKINTNDADMRSHVILSMIKVSAAIADIPPVSSQSYRKVANFDLVFILFFYTCVKKK